MTAIFGPVNSATLERTAQLIQRSNQFNLTTRRHSAADVLAMMADETWLTRTVSLRDRFGDNGLICVLFAKITGDVLDIDTWLMSCRVLEARGRTFLDEPALRVRPRSRPAGTAGRVHPHGQECPGARPLRQPWLHTARLATIPGIPPGNSR